MFLSKRLSASWPAVLGVLLLSGCETPELEVESDKATPSSSVDSQPEAIEQGPVKSAAEPIEKKNNGNKSDLRTVFRAWESGTKDEAVSALLQIDWVSSAAIGDIPILGVTEKEFSVMVGSEKENNQALAMKLASDSKAVLRHAFSLAEHAESEGDNEKAKLHYEAVKRLGNVLAKPERLAVLQMMGKSLIQMADEKLTAQ